MRYVPFPWRIMLQFGLFRGHFQFKNVRGINVFEYFDWRIWKMQNE